MKILSVREMRKLDRLAIEEYKIPAIILMENAGRTVSFEAAKFILRRISNDAKNRAIDNKTGFQVTIFCGGGNNGGDGFVAARYLLNQGFSVNIVLFKEKNSYKNESLINLTILEKLKADLICYKELLPEIENGKIPEIIKHSVLLIDALLGTGFTPPVSKEMEDLISFINTLNVPVVSVDIPSGLDGDKGLPQKAAIKAALTVTFGCAKRGHFENDGRKYTGDLIVADIGFPQKIIADL